MKHEINSVQLVFNFQKIEEALQFLTSISPEKCTKDNIKINYPKEEVVQPQRATIKKPNKKYCTPAEIAELFSLNVGTMANMRARRQGPVYFKTGRRILYSVIDIEQWITSSKIMTTG